jgi:hypothetical protein
MLLVPESLIARWSWFMPQVIEAESLLAACIDRAPAAHAMSLSLEKVHQLGWRSREAQELYAHACERLSNWCVQHRHYVHNVSTLQDIDLDAGMSLSTDSDRRRMEQPQQRWRRFRRASEFDARVMERIRWKTLYQDLPAWSIAARKLQAGHPILVAAPLCMTRGEDDEIHAFLCDFPPFVRTPQDATLPLVMSSGGKQSLFSQLGSEAAAWHPFCRILGILQTDSLGPRVEVLQVELAVPLPDAREYSHRASWDEALVKEATSAAFGTREAEWAQKELEEYQSEKMLQFLRVDSKANLQSPVAAGDNELLARSIALAGSESPFRALTRETGSPFKGMDAFWCSIAALMPSWKTDFPLSNDKLSALLIAFDKAYGDEWHKVAADPALVGAIRYTPAVIAEARTRIAGLLV